MAHVIGIDVSTTATKAVLIDDAGTVVGIGMAEYDYDVPKPLWSEQDPALWWDGAQAAIRQVLSTSGVSTRIFSWRAGRSWAARLHIRSSSCNRSVRTDS